MFAAWDLVNTRDRRNAVEGLLMVYMYLLRLIGIAQETRSEPLDLALALEVHDRYHVKSAVVGKVTMRRVKGQRADETDSVHVDHSGRLGVALIPQTRRPSTSHASLSGTLQDG